MGIPDSGIPESGIGDFCGQKAALFAPDTRLTPNSALFSTQRGHSSSPDSMQRITARFLLLIALVGTIVPVAMEAKAAPPHTCCLCKGSHRCHEPAQVPSEQPVLVDVGCCHNQRCRARTSSHWAHPRPSLNTLSIADPTGCASGAQPDQQVSTGSSLLRSRAPPSFLRA